MAKIFTITEGLENMGALRTGGQGSVYKAKKMGTIISAVKLLPTPIHTENVDDKNFRDFQNEVEKLKKVNESPSPHVVKILNSGLTESGSLPYIEMEYIEGPDLEELLQAPHDPIFRLRDVLKLAEQLASALAHCHKVGVKHGDIKSNNIKFNNATGNYILLDFGLAVMSDEQRRSSMRNAGAVEFMAPEQYEGRMLFETDIYSYGVVLYELLAGTVPFPLVSKSESARNAVMLAHIERNVPDIMNLRASRLPVQWTLQQHEQELDVPEWLLQLIGKCLMKSPEERYANGMELHDAFCAGMELSSRNENQHFALQEFSDQNQRLQSQLNVYRRILKWKWPAAIITLLLISLSVIGIIDIFDKTDAKEASVTEQKRNPGPTALTNDTLQPVINNPVSGKAADSARPAPKKVKRTKDGLVDDVPEF